MTKKCGANPYVIILINILIILIVFFVSDYITYKIECYKERKFCENVDSKELKMNFYVRSYIPKLNTFRKNYQEQKNHGFRPVEGLMYKRPSVVIFGCSYAYGHLLPNDKILSYKLAKLAKRPIYNRAFPSWSVQHMLFQLSQDDFSNEVKNPEYFIYIMMDDHVNRLRKYIFAPVENEFYLRYKLEDGKLKEVEPNFMFLRGFYIVKEIQNFITDELAMKEEMHNKNFDFLKLHFLESKKITAKKFPNAKFVILKYINYDGNWYMETSRWKELEDAGFIVLDTNTLTGKDLSLKEYRFLDGHPNEKAWDVLAPKLVKRLSL